MTCNVTRPHPLFYWWRWLSRLGIAVSRVLLHATFWLPSVVFSFTLHSGCHQSCSPSRYTLAAISPDVDDTCLHMMHLLPTRTSTRRCPHVWRCLLLHYTEVSHMALLFHTQPRAPLQKMHLSLAAGCFLHLLTQKSISSCLHQTTMHCNALHCNVGGR